MTSQRDTVAALGGLSKRRAATIGVIAILGCEFFLRDVLISPDASKLLVGLTIAAEWVVALLLLFYWIPKVENRRWTSVGFRKFKLRYVWLAFGAYVVYALVSTAVEQGLKAADLQTLRDLSPTLKDYGFPLLLGLFLTGTFVEEVLYRGYVIERLTELTGRRWIGAVVSWIAFSLVHLRFFGPGPTLEVAIIGAAFVALYLAAKSIWPSIIVHGINDTVGFLIGPYLR
jgi:uncharacterized protein